MKKYFIYKYGLLLSVLIALGCSSCQKDDYVQYDAGYLPCDSFMKQTEMTVSFILLHYILTKKKISWKFPLN